MKTTCEVWRANNTMSEDKLQIAYFKWLTLAHPTERSFVFHVPNGKRVGARIGAILKAMGVMPGVADIFLMRHKCFLELKKSNKDKLSKTQLVFKDRAIACGYDYHEAHSLEEAISITQKIIKRN